LGVAHGVGERGIGGWQERPAACGGGDTEGGVRAAMRVALARLLECVAPASGRDGCAGLFCIEEAAALSLVAIDEQPQAGKAVGAGVSLSNELPQRVFDCLCAETGAADELAQEACPALA